MYVWKDGSVIFSLKQGLADSITFADPLLKQKFSVAADKQVRFSPGNLQYNDYSGEWRFAEHQYDVVGADNANIADFWDGWIDLFGWATCGWDPYFLPTSTSTDYTDYLVGGAWDNNIPPMGDWGYVNPISNGGNADYLWRTPSSQEWDYLLAGRPNASALFGLATVNGQKGLVILPDAWQLPAGAKFTPSTQSRLVYSNGLYEDADLVADNYADNVYSLTEWTRMESAGAIFLPAAGRRWGVSVYNLDQNPWGVYWSTTTGAQEREGNVRALSFYVSGVTPLAETCRAWGCSVRVVQDVEQ